MLTATKPRVTEILKATGYIDTRWYTEAGRDRGTKLHECTEAIDVLGLPIDTWPEYEAKLKTWVEWKADTGAVIKAVEQSVESDEYIGRCDRVVSVYGSLWVVDIKSGSKQYWHKLQVTAYALALGLDRGLIVYLGMGKRGREVQVDFDFPQYAQEWAAAVERYKTLGEGNGL